MARFHAGPCPHALRPARLGLARLGLAALGLSALGLSPGALHGQSAGAGAAVQYYSFLDAEAAGLESFVLVTTPFAVGIPVAGLFALDVSGAYAQGIATGPEGTEARLSGPTDTELGFSVLLGDDRVVFSSSLTLPTGQDIETLEEATVAAVVAAELLPFSIATWGAGGGAGGDVALAFQAGEWGIGIGGGYWAAKEFVPTSDVTYAYRPGDQLQARVALDRDVGESGTFSLILGLQRFGEDELDGTNLFRSGNRLEGMASYAFALGLRGSALLYGGVYHREQGVLLLEASLLDGATDSPSQQLFMGGASLLIPASPRVSIMPDVSMRVFRSGDGVGQGWLATAGSSFEIRVAGHSFGRNVVLSPSAKLRLGRVIVREDSESGIVGWEAGITLRVGAGR